MHLVLHRMAILALILTALSCSKKKDGLTSAPRPIQEGALPQIAETPDKVLGYLMAPDLASFLEGMEKILGKAAPIPVGATQALLLQQLIEWGFKDTSVVELRQPVYALLLDPKQYSPPWVIGLRVKSKEAFLEALKPAWKQKATTDGVIELAQDQVDPYGVFKGGQGDSPNKNGAKGGLPSAIFVKPLGASLLIAPKPESIKLGESVLEKIAATLPANPSATGVVFVDHLRAIFQSELTAVPALMDAAFKQNPLLAQTQNADLARWMITTVAGKFLSFVQQTKQMIVFADIRPERALAELGIVPEKDSFFQKFLAAQQRKPLRLIDGLPEGHFLAVGGNVQWQLFRQEILDTTRDMVKLALQKDATQEWSDAFTGILDVMGDEMAFSESLAASGVGLVELIAVKDETRARKVFAELVTTSYAVLAEKLQASVGTMRMKGPSPLGAYQGVELQSYEVTWDFAKAASPQAEMLKKLYGDKLQFVTAVFDMTLALTLSRQAEADMKATIDRLQKKGKGLTASAAYQDAAGRELGKNAGGAVFFSIAQMIGMGTQAVASAMGLKAQPGEAVETKSGLFMRFRSTPELWTMALRLPVKHMEDIGTAVKSIMQFSATAP